MPAVLADGSTIDAFTERPVNWSNFTGISADYDPGTRWRRYLRNLAKPQFDHHLHPFAEYLARRHDARNGPDKRIESFEIVFIEEDDLPSGGAELTRHILLEYHRGP
jgi:hypothetical protein